MLGPIRATFGLARLLGPERSSDLGGALARVLGPLLPVHRIARANLEAALPHLGRTEREAILRTAWANLGRTGAEYPHLAALFDYEYGSGKTGRVEVQGVEHFAALRDDQKPGLIFSAHLGNWELPAICAARYGLDTTAVFRAPNDAAVARVVHEVRSQTM